MNLQEVREKINLRKYARDYYGLVCNSKGLARCPHHPPDKHPSFAINFDDGVWKWFDPHDQSGGCIPEFEAKFAKCSINQAKKNLLKRFGDKESNSDIEEFPAKTTAVNNYNIPAESTIRYIYRNQDGEAVLMKEKRILIDGEKTFFWFHKEGGQWMPRMGGHKHIPFNLDKFKSYERIVVTEGEKDCCTINNLKIGEFATCSPTGAYGWPASITQYFKGKKELIFLYDLGVEEETKKHATKLKKAFPGIYISIAKVPMDEEGSDITDYLETQADKQMAFFDVLDKRKEFKGECVHIINVDQVKLKPIRWLWHYVFPVGKVSLLVGDGGAGKSYFVSYMAARITTGKDWINPEGKQLIGTVVIITTEDGVADTIKARATLMGTDQTKLKIIDGVSEGMDKDIVSLAIGKNLDLIKKAIIEIGNVRLLVFDPITEFIGNIDDHRTAPTRTALAPLVALAEKYDMTILIISHLNKDDAKKLIYRTTGSQSYVNMARAVWAIAEDEEKEDRRFLMPIKQNLSKKPPAFAFSITDSQGIVFEREPVKVVANAVFGTEDQKYERSQLEEAKTFLLEALEIGSVKANEIFNEARQAGISEITLRRAKSALNIISYKTFENDAFFWIWKYKK